MSENLIAQPDRSPEAFAKLFDEMAAKIRLNKDNAFGGAFVIIPPPENGGEPIQTLILDSKQDAGQFFTLLKTKAEAQILALDHQARNQQAGFPRR
jgi:hypothetical protein